MPSRTNARIDLRTALRLDALASGTMGVLLFLAARPLSGLFELPVALLRGVGLLLVPFALFLGWLAMRPHLSRPLAWSIVIANVLWVVASLLVPATGWFAPTTLGTAFVIAQAAAVALFAHLEYAGLRELGVA